MEELCNANLLQKMGWSREGPLMSVMEERLGRVSQRRLSVDDASVDDASVEEGLWVSFLVASVD